MQILVEVGTGELKVSSVILSGLACIINQDRYGFGNPTVSRAHNANKWVFNPYNFANARASA